MRPENEAQAQPLQLTRPIIVRNATPRMGNQTKL